MSKFAFTEQGAASFIADLYTLSQPALQLEADAAGDDFQAWIASHFELDSTQLAYLATIDPQWIGQAAADTRHFLENRLPIELHKAVPPAGRSAEGDRGKLLDLDKKNSASYAPGEGTTETEVLSFSISYSES